MTTDGYISRVLTRLVAFIGAAGITGLLLALQAGLPRGAIVAAIYLAAFLSPFALIDALFVASPRAGPARLARIALAFLLLLAISAAEQWRALTAVPFDLQVQIAVETLVRNFAFLGIYLLLEALIGLAVGRRVPA